ncbi:MAG: hypothetical protein COA45_05065 [Zetaproteobacteria bacterium]|nr:MAG: hypothetical protein COA45_05065 [Zetaproteobacteria bacterium]
MSDNEENELEKERTRKARLLIVFFISAIILISASIYRHISYWEIWGCHQENGKKHCHALCSSGCGQCAQLFSEEHKH